MSYKAIILPIRTYKHPNADRLKVAFMPSGEQIIVGAAVEDGTLGVFFPTDGKLSTPFMEANNLIARYDENKVKIPESGYFDASGRVRSQKIRGVRSDGFWMPLHAFDYISTDLALEEGQLIDTIVHNGVEYPICSKYYTKATQEIRDRVQKQGRGKVRLASFPEHYDTSNIRHYIGMLQAGDLLTVTRKLHGTSQREGYIYVQKHDSVPKKGWWNKLKGFLKLPVSYESNSRWEWERVLGSRTVIIDGAAGGWYGTNEFRYRALEGIQLHKGEILYYEVVGYVNPETPIMKSQSVPVEMPDVKMRYGDTITYAYGCAPGQLDVYVYRIVQTNASGVLFELSWQQVKRRCLELGIKHVPEVEQYVYDGGAEALLHRLNRMVNGQSGEEAVYDVIDPTHPQEGLVIRADSVLGTNFYKMKSVAFLALEGHAKALETYIDREEIS